MNKFKWTLPEKKEIPVNDGDLRIVNLPVEVLFEWSDKIIADYDSETDIILEYKSGYVMKILPKQYSVYNNEKTTFLASTFKEDNLQKS